MTYIERFGDLVIFLLLGKASLPEGLTGITIQPDIVKKETILWRRPRQLSAHPFLESTIKRFVDTIAEISLPYYATLEVRHKKRSASYVSDLLVPRCLALTRLCS